MLNNNVIHTFSVNEAVEFLLDNTPFAVPMLLDAHTRPDDRDRIVERIRESDPDLHSLVLKTLNDLESESHEDRYRSQEDFISFMNVDGLKYLDKVMLVRPRAHSRSKKSDYSEPLPIPDKAKDMKEFLYEYGSDYIEAIIMPEFNSGTQLMKLITMLREDASDPDNKVAADIFESVKSIVEERVRYEDPAHKESVTKRLRELLMEPEDADLRFEQVDDINFSLKLAMANEREVASRTSPVPENKVSVPSLKL